MKTPLLLLLITLSEATVGVFVKLTGDAIPIYTLNFYAVAFAALFLMISMPWATGQHLHFPKGNLKDTLIFGGMLLIGSGVWLTYAMSRRQESRAAAPCQCA